MDFINSKVVKDACASASASLLTAALLHPLDVIRITQMANQTSFLFTMRDIYNSNYKKTIYGRVANFYRAMPISMMAFCLTYTLFLPMKQFLKDENHLNITNSYLLYTIANIPPSIVTMTVVNPLWTIKSHQISDNLSLCGLRETTRNLYRSSGIRGFYKGLLFGYLNNLNGIVSFTFYDIFKDLLLQQYNMTAAIADGGAATGGDGAAAIADGGAAGGDAAGAGDGVKLGPLDIGLCSMASKVIGTVVSYPLFVLRIRHQVVQTTLPQVCKSACSQHPRIWCYGIGVTLVQQLPRNAIMMMLYEHILTLLN